MIVLTNVDEVVPETRWWGVEHVCGGARREYPVLHWADEPEGAGAGPRRAFECDACGDRFAFHPDRK